MYLSNLLGLALISTFMCCSIDCDFKSEPQLDVSFTNPREYVLVYALKDEVDPITTRPSSFYQLPINLSSKNTIYIFTLASGETDTLEVTYSVDVSFESKRCGFTGVLEDLNIGEATTFESANLSGSSSISIQ